MPTSTLNSLVGHSASMGQVHWKIERLARTDSTVLIHGETGTGKELAAEAIHALSARKSAPLIKVNCSALSEHLLESELFGHVKGAFTSALTDREGRFEAARGGSLFLDEIGDISPAIQVKLLRVLEQRSIERVGCNVTHPIDVRIITATNKNLMSEVASGHFRDDLFYRLNTVILTLPPLSEHRDDIALLAGHFMHHFNTVFSKKINGFTDEAMGELISRPWPGNVRELKNAVEFAFIYCQTANIDIQDLPPRYAASPWPLCGERRKSDRRVSAPFSETPLPPFQAAKWDAAILHKALERHHWHLCNTAEALGIHRTTLWRLMRRFGLDNRCYPIT